MTIGQSFSVRRAVLGGLVLLSAAAVAGFSPSAHAVGERGAAASTTAAPPAGEARIWIYRDYEPYQSMATPYVRLNGAIVGVSQPGAVFYRDVPAGTYTVSVESEGMDVNQFATVAAAPGQQVFVKVLVSDSWDSGGGGGSFGGSGGWARPTFYTWQIQPQMAEAEISRMPLSNGS